MNNRCYEHFRALLREHRLVGKNDHVLVTLSGGADSVALMRLLLRFRDEFDTTLRVTACHLNHGIRREAERDAIFCRELCAVLNVPFIEDTVDTPAYADEHGLGLEEAARNLRYDFFRRVADSEDAGRVATAHHADDNAETLWMRIARGTGVRGLAGIPVRRPIAPGSDVQLIRPVLNQRTEHLRNFLRAQQQTWCEDHTNRNLAHERNRVRHLLLPSLTAWFGGDAVVPLNRLAEAARAVDAFARRRVASHLDDARVDYGRGRLTFDVDWFAGIPHVLHGEAARELLRRLGAPMADMGEQHVNGLAALVREADGSDALSLPGVEATRSAGRVELSLEQAAEEATEPTPLELPGTTELPPPLGGALVAELLDAEPPPELDTGPTVEVVDADALQPPLVARVWRKGDRFKPLGAPGTRKLQDVFTDAGVPSFERARTPVVCDEAGIVWVVGVRIADRVKVTDGTRRCVRLTRRAWV